MDLGGYVRFEGKLDKRVRVLAAMVVAREFECSTCGARRPARRAGRTCPSPRSPRSASKHSRGVPPEDAQIIDFTRDLINKHRVERRRP